MKNVGKIKQFRVLFEKKKTTVQKASGNKDSIVEVSVSITYVFSTAFYPSAFEF